MLAIRRTEDGPMVVELDQGEPFILGQDVQEPVTHDLQMPAEIRQQQSHSTTMGVTELGYNRTANPKAEEATCKGARRRPPESCEAPGLRGDTGRNEAAVGGLDNEGKEGGADAGAWGGTSEKPPAPQSSEVSTRTTNNAYHGDESMQVGAS